MPEGMTYINLVGALWDRVRSFFMLMWEYVGETIVSIWPSVVDKSIEGIKFAWQDADNVLWDVIVEQLVMAGMIGEDQAKFLLQFKALPTLPSLIMVIAFAAQFSLNWGWTHLRTSSAELQYSLNTAIRPALAEVNTLIRAAFIAPEYTSKIRETLAKHGLSEEQIDLSFLSAYSLYDVETAKNLFLRGKIDDNKLFERMREMGYTDTRIKEMMGLWEVIPGPQDLFWMVGKEAFEPDMIRKIGLDDEFPVDQVQWLEMQGVSEFWAKKYWYAHWEQPSLQMGFEMLHRGIINEGELDMLFRAQEIPPFWREKLTQMTYLPYTRVDTRRMFDWGVLDVEGVYNNYRDLGYDHEHAVNLTQWTILQTEGSEKEISLGQIITNFEARVLERKDAKALIQLLGYTEEKAEFLLVSSEYNQAEKLQKKQLEIIKDKYTMRLIDKFEALRQLHLLNLSYQQIDVLVEEWDLDLFKDRKIPSKTDLEKFVKKGVINKAEYFGEMDKLGYSNKYIEWYYKSIMAV